MITTDYQILDSRLMNLLNLEFFNNNITEVITTNSNADSFIRKLCVTKGIEFKIFDLGFRFEPRALEMLVKDVDKFVILSKFHNSFYLELFRVNESFLVFHNGEKYATKDVKKILLDSYKKRISKGHNVSKAYDEEVTNVLQSCRPTEFLVYRKESS